MLDSQGSRLDFWSGQGVKFKNLMGQDLDPGRGWKYSRLCGVPPLQMLHFVDHAYHYCTAGHALSDLLMHTTWHNKL